MYLYVFFRNKLIIIMSCVVVMVTVDYVLLGYGGGFLTLIIPLMCICCAFNRLEKYVNFQIMSVNLKFKWGQYIINLQHHTSQFFG